MNNMNHGAPSNPLEGQTKTLWIGDVESWMNEQNVAAQFDNIATVSHVKIIRDKVKGTPVGYGFVEFADAETAKEIFTTLNGHPIPGSNRTFKLNWASHGGGVARAQPSHGGGRGDQGYPNSQVQSAPTEDH